MKHTIILFISIASYTLQAQTTDFKRYNFGICNEFSFDTSGVVLSPVLQYYPEGNIGIFIGPAFQVPSDDYRHYEQFGYRLGGFYMLPKHRNKKIEEVIEIELEHFSSKYNTLLFDYATPGIPIKATIAHEHAFTDLSFLFGARFRFAKRFYVGALAGYKIRWLEIIDPDSIDYQTYLQYPGYADSPNSTHINITGAFELGIYF